MSRRILLLMARMLVVVTASLAVSSCSKKIQHLIVPNQLPTVRITSAPIDTNAVCNPDPVRSCYSLIVDWVGYDPDGRVDHYLYAIDPPRDPGSDTTWFTSTRNEERLLFRSSQVIPFGNREIPKARDYHEFVLKAVDNIGESGPSVSRAFFSFTQAPNVNIINPLPSEISTPLLTPSVRITWAGTDDDGVFHDKPIGYKYILLNASSEFPIDKAIAHPDSLRAYYAPNFAGWDSVGGDTTTVQYTNLSPNSEYVFVVVAFDEAGAYSPIFKLTGNMLRFRVGFAGALGSTITAFNEFFNYTWRPGYCVCPTTETFIEVQAGKKITFNWFAEPPTGADVRSYRWVMDSENLTDETARTDEEHDTWLWSSRSLNNTSVQVGPFPGNVPPDPPEEHRFYIEAEDNVGFRSLGIIRFQVVRYNPQPGRVLVVKDTRLKPESYRNGCVVTNPPTPWPTQAELDTFLFARGNTPWKCYPVGTITPRGILADYGDPVTGPDTVGTRIQKRDLTVRLSKLSTYEFVIWMVDAIGANFDEDGTSFTEPMPALKYMSGPGRFNTLAAFIKAGGKAWLLGGGGGFATNKPWDDLGNNVPTITFSSNSPRRELVPGRFMFDLARWQSEFRASAEPALVARYLGRYRDRPAPGGLSSYTQFASELPPILDLRVPATDPLPPNRTNTGRFYPQVAALEYLQIENHILENTSNDPTAPNEESTLDTLYRASGGGLPPPFVNPHNVVMSYYHGPVVPQGFIFTGFDIWSWKRTQCKQYVDFVMKRMWGLPQNTFASSRAVSWEASAPQSRVADAGGSGTSPMMKRMELLRRSWFPKTQRPKAPSGTRN